MKIKSPLTRLLYAVIVSGLLSVSPVMSLAAPRPVQPPWPQATLKIFGFDSAYAHVPWRYLAINEEEAVLPESWSGFSLSREGFISSPVIVPMRGAAGETNISPARGAIRFWFAANWSTASKESGGTGPGHAARLLELVNLNGKTAQTRWSLFLNDSGDSISLAGESKTGAKVLLQAPVDFTAGDWRMISLFYSETNLVLQLDTAEIASGEGLLAPAPWEEKDLGLVIGSDLFASVDSAAEGQFEELTTMQHWPKQSDWQELYFKSYQRRSLLGPMGTKEEEQAKTSALKSAGLLPENYGEPQNSEEGGGPIAYSYAEGTLWLEITGVSNNLAHVIVHGTTEDAAYEILSKDSLTNAVWAGELPIVIGAAGQDWTPTTVTVGTRTNNLFLWARTLVDTDGDGLPDWWELDHGLDPNDPDTGDTGVSDGYKDSDNDGWTNLQEYQNGTSPSQFNMPTTPQAFIVLTDATGTHAKLSWLPASGPVTNYTIQRGNDNSLIPVSSSSVSHVDSAETLPSGLYEVWLIPSYRIRAEYAAGSTEWSQWQEVADLQAPAAQFVSGLGGSGYVIVPEIPQSVATVRVGSATYGSPYYNPGNSLDIPVSQFTNGAAALTTAFIQSATNTHRYIQFILTNTAGGAIYPGYPTVDSFWDGREQLKDNLRFLLRAASPFDSFCYRYVLPGITPFLFPSPIDYAYASFCEAGEYNEGSVPFARKSVFSPFQQNYLYRNLVFSPTNLYVSGRVKTGVDWSPLHLYAPEQWVFQRPAIVEPISSVLSSNESRWTVWPESYPLAESLSAHEVGVTVEDGGILFGDHYYAMTSGARNWFGLPYLSFQIAWGSEVTEQAILSPGNDVYSPEGGYFYPETAPPAFQTVDYYFARQRDSWYDHPHEAKLPGHADFSPTNSNPLLIASVGELNFNVVGYAKLAVTNGYAGVYGYLGQYFDKAYQTTNGVVTTNETGILSPYGEFFPTEPGRTALVTMPDLETNERGTATVYVVSMNLDANHDGEMDRTFHGPDQTSANRPFQFWINNDNDSYRGEDFDASWRRDSDDNIIGNARELEDFARLWISGLPSLAATNGYFVTLSWRNYTGNPTIKLYPASEADGGNLYLQATNVALDQIAYINNAGILTGPGACMATSAPNATFTFPADYFLNFGRKHFLFEAVERGTGELLLTIAQSTNILAETSVFMDLRDVKEMYERWTIGDVGSVEPVSTPFLAADSLPVGASPFQYPHDSSTDTNTPYILHVHGWNMNTWSKNSYGETGFKRLYWQGYSGRYGIFRWPTYFNFPGLGFDLQAFDLNNYEKSEWQAWKSATGLRTLLTNLNGLYPQRVRLTAHSMGNVVAGEALRISSSAPKLAAVYVALEAAIPSHCYDSGATNREIPWVLDNVTPNVYAFYWQPGSPNYFHGFQGASNYVNFYNTNDFALRSWQVGQNLKPAQSIGYTYSAGLNKFYRGATELVFPTDRHEIFSFCAEPRCYALGAQPNVGGQFASSMAFQVDLNAPPYNFGDEIPGHSGQYRFRNQTCWPFWDELLKALELKPR